MSFRAIDIDALEEEQFRPSDYIPASLFPQRDPAVVERDVKATTAEVRSLLQRYDVALSRDGCLSDEASFWTVTDDLCVCRGQSAQALAKILEDPPYGPNLDNAKVDSALLLSIDTRMYRKKLRVLYLQY